MSRLSPPHQKRLLSDTRAGLFFLAAFQLLFLSSCSSYYFSDRVHIDEPNKNELFEEIEYISVESFTGRSGGRMLSALLEEIAIRGGYKITSRPRPEELERTALLSAEVMDIIFYESQVVPEASNRPNSNATDAQSDKDAVSFFLDLRPNQNPIRVNSSVTISFKMRRASDNLPLYDKKLGRSYQQVYRTPAEIRGRPDADKETDRLGRLIISSFIYHIDKEVSTASYFFEQGMPPELDLRGRIGFETNAVMVKGLRYALVKDWESALLTWLVVAFEPTDQDTKQTFLANRASALFNMGQVLRLNQEWKLAAQMYAEANLAVPKLYYAQYWADAVIKNRLEEQKKAEDTNTQSADGSSGYSNSSWADHKNSSPVVSANDEQKDYDQSYNQEGLELGVLVPTWRSEKFIKYKQQLTYFFKSEFPEEFEKVGNRSLILKEDSLYFDVGDI